MKKVIILIVCFFTIAGAGVWMILGKYVSTEPTQTQTLSAPSMLKPMVEQKISSSTQAPPRLARGNISSHPDGSTSHGEKMGFIKNISSKDGRVAVDMDDIIMFFEEEAQLAAREDGDCYEELDRNGRMSCLIPDGHYTRNPATTTREIEVASSSNNQFLRCDAGPLIFIATKDLPKKYSSKYTPCSDKDPVRISGFIPYWYTEDTQGRIVSITQQYVP